MRYVYPVLSRRSGGLSIGINLNPNNACNWRCIYCQVPGLVRGSAPSIDLPLLEEELTTFLTAVNDGSFYDAYQVPAPHRIIRDIALSGNGEPTSSPDFDQVIAIIDTSSRAISSDPIPARVLITNGSLIKRAAVQRGLNGWKNQGGEIWFKIDSATQTGMKLINNVTLSEHSLLQNLAIAASYCPLWIQTCLFGTTLLIDRDSEQRAYFELLQSALDQAIPLQGILLYGLARLSMQPEADVITALTPEEIQNFAEKITQSTGLRVKVAQ